MGTAAWEEFVLFVVIGGFLVGGLPEDGVPKGGSEDGGELL